MSNDLTKVKGGNDLGIYAINDKKGEKYDIPFFAHSDLFAKRRFMMMANEPGTILHQFLKDFDLHKLGNFDVVTGNIKPQNKVVVEGLQIKKHIEEGNQENLPGI